MSQKNEVLMIATGGTIVSPKKTGKAVPDTAAVCDLLDRAERYFNSRGFIVKIKRPFGEAGLDSSLIGPAQWVRLTNEIRDAFSDRFKGALIVHGTDTMAYTAAWLSMCFACLPGPIIMTGSQQSPDDIPFDGYANLLGAARLVAEGMDGVAIYFDGKLFNGFCAHKGHTEDFNAFRALKSASFHDALRGQAIIGYARGGEEPPGIEKILSMTEAEIIARARGVGVCFVLPGGEPEFSGEEKIILIIGFGAGNMPRQYHEALTQAFSGIHKPCIIACSQAQEGYIKAFLYGGVGIGELRDAGFTVFEQSFSLEFTVAAAYYSALCSDEPGQALLRYLKKGT